MPTLVLFLVWPFATNLFCGFRVCEVVFFVFEGVINTFARKVWSLEEQLLWTAKPGEDSETADSNSTCLQPQSTATCCLPLEGGWSLTQGAAVCTYSCTPLSSTKQCALFIFYFILTQGYVCIDFGERERGRERNIDMREEHWSVASCILPDLGSN